MPEISVGASLAANGRGGFKEATRWQLCWFVLLLQHPLPPPTPKPPSGHPAVGGGGRGCCCPLVVEGGASVTSQSWSSLIHDVNDKDFKLKVVSSLTCSPAPPVASGGTATSEQQKDSRKGLQVILIIRRQIKGRRIWRLRTRCIGRNRRAAASNCGKL